MQVLITGGAGFIGSNLVSLLLQNGIKVKVLDDLSTGSLENLKGLDCQFFKGSIMDVDACLESSRGCTAIVHLAALGSVPRSIADPIATHNVNVSGTLNVLESARVNDSHLTFASSSSVYGYVSTLPRQEDLPTRPSSPYGASKLAAEAYVLAYAKSFDLKVMPLRFFNVYGPKQSSGHAYAAVIPNFIEAALKNNPIFVDGDGEQTRDFTFVDTVTDVILTTLTNQLVSEIPINLALGTSTSINELTRMIQNEIGPEIEIVHRESRNGDVRRSPSNPDLFTKIFPHAKVTSIYDGLTATIDWFKSK